MYLHWRGHNHDAARGADSQVYNTNGTEWKLIQHSKHGLVAECLTACPSGKLLHKEGCSRSLVTI